MKHVVSLLLVILMISLPLAVGASSVAPSNPMASKGVNGAASSTSTATATMEPGEMVPAEPQPEEEDYARMLTDEMIAQLDEEARDYLTGQQEMITPLEGLRNILLVGLDARPGETRSRSDTMIILTLDGKNNEIRMTSIMRDMYVSLPGKGNNRINTAWVFGGPELLLSTIEENLGLHMDEYLAVDLNVLIDVVDALGGLTLTVENERQLNAINGVIDAYNAQFHDTQGGGLLTDVGEQLMTGKQVQAYARYRKIDSDIQRTERQREVLMKMYEKLQTMSVMELTGLAANVLDRVETNLTLSDIISLIPVMYQMRGAEILQLNIPADAQYQSKTVSGMAVLVPNLEVCRDRLEAFVNAKD